MQFDDNTIHDDVPESGHTHAEQHEINTFEQQLTACKQESDQWKERYVRINADLENMRRRMAKDHETSLVSAQSAIFKDLLSVIDNFDRALSDQKNAETSKEWVDGIVLIRKELATLLSTYGVEEITENTVFDPEMHEALAHVESASHNPGEIVEVLQKGYRFKGRILRYAKVTVAR